MDMTEKPDKTVIGTALVWIQGSEQKVYIKPFRGCVLEVDLTRYRFKSAEEAGQFIAKQIDSAGWDRLILSNLVPVKRQDGGGA